MKSLLELYDHHDGKVSDKWSLYITEYDRLFSHLRPLPIKILEIGIQNGGSLEIWSKFFPKAETLVGCDINPDCEKLAYDDPRIHLVIGNANLTSVEEEILGHANSFDLIIDDGSHTSSDIVKSFARYFRHLNNGGLFVAEDLHCSYWSQFEGGLYYPYSSMAFFKRLADLINHEHWGIDKERHELLKGFSEEFDIEFDDIELAKVHSIEFFNSTCVIHKKNIDDNILGIRVIAGKDESVVSGLHSLTGEVFVPFQTENPWSAMPQAPDEAWQDLTNQLVEKDNHIEGLNQAIVEKDNHIEGLNQAIVEKDNHIKGLNQAVVEKDNHIEELNQAVVEKDNHIEGLNQAVVEKDNHIEGLNQAVVEKDNHIEGLNQAVVEKDNHIEGLNQAVVEKDNHIEGLNQEVVEKDNHISNLTNIAEIRQDEITDLSSHIHALRTSTSWRITAPLRWPIYQVKRAIHLLKIAPAAARKGGGYIKTAKKVGTVLRTEGRSGIRNRLLTLNSPMHQAQTVAEDGEVVDRNDYAEWIRRYDTLDDEARMRIKKKIESFECKPLISVIMPVYDPPLNFLDEAIWSVRNQLYPHWEFCIADDASKNPKVRDLLNKHANEDSRIKLVFRETNGHISAASNSALEIATGEFVALFDNDDLLPEHALFWVAQTIIENPDAGLIYSDEDKIDESGNHRYAPYFKCEFNPVLFWAQNMICHLGVYHRSLLKDIGGFRIGFEGAQDYDLALRVIEKINSKEIIHIPRVLYHWRAIQGSTALTGNEKNYAAEAGRKAVNDHLEKQGIVADVVSAPEAPALNRVKLPVPDDMPLVSIIIPTRDRVNLISTCIKSIFEISTYNNYEIIIVDNGSIEEETLQFFSTLPKERVKIIRDELPFNFSRLNNVGAKVARGSILCLMNNDIEVITPEWLEEMVSFALLPEVGCIGSRLWFPDGSLQHGGIILGIGSVAGHAHKYLNRGAQDYFGRAVLHQNFSAVTAACLVVRKEIYNEVGGLDEEFPVAFNDVDFCLRVQEAGYRNVWTPYAEMIHHESISRGAEDTPEKQARFKGEVRKMLERWGDKLRKDPVYNPNLTLDYEDLSLAWPPRVKRLGVQ